MAIDAQNSRYWYETWMYNGGKTTLDAYRGRETQLEEDIEWMKSPPLYILDENRWLISHAGVPRGKTLEQALKPEAEWYIPVLWYRGELEGLGYVQVVGHTTLSEPILREKEIYVGRGASPGKRLTALELSSVQIFQSE